MYVAVQPVKTETGYREALKRIDELLLKQDKITEQEESELDVISDLVWLYEEEHYPIDPPSDPVEVLKFWMEQKNLKQADLVPYIGHKNQVSEILAGKRKLTLNMIKKLRHGLGISAESLL